MESYLYYISNTNIFILPGYYCSAYAAGVKNIIKRKNLRKYVITIISRSTNNLLESLCVIENFL